MLTELDYASYISIHSLRMEGDHLYLPDLHIYYNIPIHSGASRPLLVFNKKLFIFSTPSPREGDASI